MHGDSFLNTMNPITEDSAAQALAPAPMPAPRRWEAIASELRQDIVQGLLPPGARLPNETELAQRFGVHRHTLRQAMQSLVREGFVQVRHGSGTYVRELVLDYALRRRTRLTQNLAEAGESASRELMSAEEALAGDWAAPLRVSARSRVLLLRTRARVRGRVVGVTESAFPLPRFVGLAEAFAQHGTVTAALAALGVHDYTRARSVIAARLPTQAEADALARPLTQPLLVVNYTNCDLQGVPVQAASTLFAADAVQLTVGPDDWDAA